MSEAANSQARRERTPSGARQVLQWARCHPGMLVMGSLAVAALLAEKCVEAEPDPPFPPQTEADFVDGETPLFV